MSSPINPFSHVDLRVPSMETALPFYEKLLPALGFGHTFHSPKWKVFAADGELPSAAYFAIMEDAAHIPSANIVAFWAPDRERVDQIAALVKSSGGTISAGPKLFSISKTYYAVYFDDPCGNKLEVVHRLD